MNIFTQLASQLLVNKKTLVQLLKTLKFSNEFIDEFRNDHILINETIIRQQVHLLCKFTDEKSFQELCCYEHGVQFVFHTTLLEYLLIRFRLSFDIKLIELSLDTEEQSLRILVDNIQLKSLNQISRPFRFYVQSKVRTLVIDELERVCTEQQLPYERLFENIHCPLVYRISLMNIKALDHLRQRYLIIGNRSILDLIQITTIEHREQAIVLGYRLKTSFSDDASSPTTHATLVRSRSLLG